MSVTYKLDSKGFPFEFPKYALDKAEFAKVMSEINTNYDAYKQYLFCVHKTCGINGKYYAYYFENHGFNDYNFYMVDLED